MPAIYNTLVDNIKQGNLVAMATVIAGPGLGSKLLIFPNGTHQGNLGDPELEQQILDHARALLHSQKTERLSLELAGEKFEVFIDIYPPPKKLIIIGGVHIAIPLVDYANKMGFKTIIVDPRSAFANRERFPHADQLIIKWPDRALEDLHLDESSFVAVLSHDEKLDNPALKTALNRPARYIGALGSRKTHAKRVASLKEMGVADEELARIHSPIGLNIGARGAQEIALSVMSQIIAVDHGIGLK